VVSDGTVESVVHQGIGDIHPPCEDLQYQLNHANHLEQRCALSRSSHDMIDSSLTTPLPHLKSLYCTHMGGLAVSGSHGLREYTELKWWMGLTQDAMLVLDCTLSNPLRL
jgi:hypothetical protein